MNEVVETNTDKKTIADKIYTIRGVQVMLDSDLAELYGYETKNLNKQVKRNIDRFPIDFMFQLNADEVSHLRFQNGTSNSHGGTRYFPYAFTEQGVYMLATVLKSDIAIKQSIKIMRTFKEMRHYLVKNQQLLTTQDYLRLSMQVNNNTNEIKKMVTKDYFEEVMKEFISPNKIDEYLILDGNKFSADLAYEQIYHSAKQSIYIVDNYIGPKTLIHLKNISSSVNITIFSDNIRKGLSLTEFNDFQNEYPNIHIKFQITNNQYHNRYIILDYRTANEMIYHCGASSKDAGNKITTINRIRETVAYKNIINKLLQNPPLKLK